MNSYPESVKVTTNHGQLPLHLALVHLACWNEASLKVLNFLIESYPEGIDQKNDRNKTPLDDLQQNNYAMDADKNGMLLLHHACNNGNSLSYSSTPGKLICSR